jgi:hypothetical protein
MITKNNIINTIIDSFSSEPGLDIYAQNLPHKQPPKLISEKTSKAYVPEIVIRSKNYTHIISVETDQPSMIDDSYIDKAKFLSEYAEQKNGTLYIVAKGSFISKIKPELETEENNINYLVI